MPAHGATLTVTSSGSLHGRTVTLRRGRQLVGRNQQCDLCLDDEHVGHNHAALLTGPAGTLIEDLGSASGVKVNGERIAGSRELADGDVIQLATVVLEFADPSASRPRPSAQAGSLRDPPPARPRPAPRLGSRWDIDRQQADRIYQSAGDQHIYHQQLLELKPMRRRAKVLLRVGWVLVILGIATQAGAAIAFASEFQKFWNSDTPPTSIPEVLLLSTVGAVIFIAGIVCMISSLFIRRSVRRREERLS